VVTNPVGQYVTLTVGADISVPLAAIAWTRTTNGPLDDAALAQAHQVALAGVGNAHTQACAGLERHDSSSSRDRSDRAAALPRGESGGPAARQQRCRYRGQRTAG
jgi:hypothetical protein